MTLWVNEQDYKAVCREQSIKLDKKSQILELLKHKNPIKLNESGFAAG